LAQVHRQLPRFLFISIASVAIAAWILWDWPYASNRVILAWAGVFTGFLMIRGVLVWWLGRSTQLQTHWLGQILTLTALLTGCFWAFALIALNPRV
ncbi:hypothetical protein ABTB40_20285, partial [Acinetobacter baumannii]